MSITIKGFQNPAYFDLCLAKQIEGTEFWEIRVLVPKEDKYASVTGIRSKAMTSLLANYIDRMYMGDYSQLVCEFTYVPYGYKETVKFINEEEDALDSEESFEDNEEFLGFLEAFTKGCSNLVDVALNR